MRKVMLIMSENICDILKSALDKKYRALPGSVSADGQDILDQSLDALIIDLFLPGTDGLTFLRENFKNLPPVVVVLTRFVSDSILDELKELNVSAVNLLPFCIDILTNQLEDLL